MNSPKVTLTDQQFMEQMVAYRGDHPILLTVAHGFRLGFGKSTPEDEARFESMVSAQGEHHAQIMRKCAQVFALDIKKAADTEEQLARV